MSPIPITLEISTPSDGEDLGAGLRALGHQYQVDSPGYAAIFYRRAALAYRAGATLSLGHNRRARYERAAEELERRAADCERRAATARIPEEARRPEAAPKGGID
jgi:hypothetical protein